MRKHAIEISARIGLLPVLRGKHHRVGVRKPLSEFLTGADFNRRLGRYMRKWRLIDRGNDRYEERVVDPMTGAVLHECREPLSKHRGHGGVRRRG